VFFDFYNFTDLLCVCFAVLHPLPGLFPCLHRVELLTRPSMYGVYLHVIGFISLYFIYLLVISLVSISLLWGVMLDPDLWVVNVNVILVFGSKRTSVGLGFLALSVKE
jgi:ABC-type sugar transport system permease subunit